MISIDRAPIIDLAATGINIRRLRYEKGLTVSTIQNYLGLESPRAVYKWQQGQSLPSVENLLGLSLLLGVSMNEILKVA